VGAAWKRRDLVLDQVMAEYRAYCAGELSARRRVSKAPDGTVEYCGADDDPMHWAICYVRAAGQAVVPLAVGHRQPVFAEFGVLDARHAWDPRLVPTPVAVIGGREYPFKPARGRHLLGVVELGREAVLLAAAEDRLLAVLVGDGAPSMLPLGRPRRVRDVDVDAMRALARPFAAAEQPDEPLRASGQTRAHHIRIVAGRRVELDEGPSIQEILAAMFADVEARATTPPRLPRCLPAPDQETAAHDAAPGTTARPKPSRGLPAPDQETAAPDAAPGEPKKPKRPKRPKLKGKTKVRWVLTYLLKMALKGSRDLVGTTGTIIRTIRASFSDFEITSEAFADVLMRIAATGTCLLAPHEKGERIWRIHLEGLCDPTSALHRRLCRETRGRVRVEEAAANQRSARPDTPAAGEPDCTVDAGAASGDATTGDASPGDASSGEHGEHGDPPTTPVSVAPSADRSTAQAEPVRSGSASTAEAEALALVRQLSMIPGARHLVLIGGCLALKELAWQAARDAARVEKAGAATAPVEQAPHTEDEAPATRAAPVEEAPAADRAEVRSGGAGALVEETPPAGAAKEHEGGDAAPVGQAPAVDEAGERDGGDEAPVATHVEDVPLNGSVPGEHAPAAVGADVGDAPPADETGEPDTAVGSATEVVDPEGDGAAEGAGGSATEVADVRDAEQAVAGAGEEAGGSAADVADVPDADPLAAGDEVPAEAEANEVKSFTAAGDDAVDATDYDVVDVDDALPWAGTTSKHAASTADAVRLSLKSSTPRASRRDAVQPRPPVLAPVQPEPRCRDLGTLGPRGPPASRSN